MDLSILLLVVSGIAAALYGAVLTHRPVSNLRSLVKTMAVLALAAYALLAGGGWLLVAALTLSALGDFFLSREGDTPFLAGMVAFLLAHVAYVVAFVGLGQSGALLADRWPVALLLIVFAAAVYRALWPGLGAFRVPVAAYCLAILAMGLSAFDLAFAGKAWLIPVGAILFMASDSVLAIARFRLTPESGWQLPSGWFVWASYWLAQIVLMLGLL
ncbi:MAG: lysoplasmalogenase [Rhodobacteraceae bacterium]|nr:lysoplasmalogenase [Paracoccaceae bacterium]